jgi:streptothricin hydrolase
MMTPVMAFLLIDAQQGLLDGEAAVPDAAGVLSRLVTLLAAARSAGTLIIHLQNDGAAGSLDEPGTPGWFIHEKVAPEPGELILRKTQDDGFEGTALEDVLARTGVTRIAVAGLLSEMCVSATVRGALARGLQVVLVHDAHATYNLDDIPASVVARVAEHALGDAIELADAVSVTFGRPSKHEDKRSGNECGFGSIPSKPNDR